MRIVVGSMIKISPGNLTMKELLLFIRESILYSIKNSQTPRLAHMKDGLAIIMGAAGERGDRKVARLAADMESAIHDWFQRGIQPDSLLSSESIEAAIFPNK
jgi:hypothetical protein